MTTAIAVGIVKKQNLIVRAVASVSFASHIIGFALHVPIVCPIRNFAKTVQFVQIAGIAPMRFGSVLNVLEDARWNILLYVMSVVGVPAARKRHINVDGVTHVCFAVHINICVSCVTIELGFGGDLMPKHNVERIIIAPFDTLGIVHFSKGRSLDLDPIKDGERIKECLEEFGKDGHNGYSRYGAFVLRYISYVDRTVTTTIEELEEEEKDAQVLPVQEVSDGQSSGESSNSAGSYLDYCGICDDRCYW